MKNAEHQGQVKDLASYTDPEWPLRAEPARKSITSQGLKRN